MLMVVSCNRPAKTSVHLVKPDPKWLDSIIAKSDTSWKKPYRNNEFVTAEYYVDKKDSIVTQLMKDSAGTIRQINIAKYDMVRLFFAEYYKNGQIKASLPLDSMGKYHGQGRFYYEDGTIKSEGVYSHGLFSGEWKNYDEKGKHIATDKYDSNGQIIK